VVARVIERSKPDTTAAEAEQFTSKVEIVDYDPGWPRQFEQQAALIRRTLGGAALAIEHVGSTSVPGLAAKRVIDIALTVLDMDSPGVTNCDANRSTSNCSCVLNISCYSPRRSISRRMPHPQADTEMLSIHGTAMQRTLRELSRAASGCPSIPGSWSRPVAKNYRDFATELDR
jgi:GrpB-like predicted nucleotidyltransferase (UPF0157 family)